MTMMMLSLDDVCMMMTLLEPLMIHDLDGALEMDDIGLERIGRGAKT